MNQNFLLLKVVDEQRIDQILPPKIRILNLRKHNWARIQLMNPLNLTIMRLIYSGESKNPLIAECFQVVSNLTNPILNSREHF